MSILHDGILYENESDVHDLGSWVCTSFNESNAMIRHYEGLSTDFSKLPTYVETGSSALCLDNGEYYKFEKTRNSWKTLG